MLGLGMTELLIVLLIVLILFGGKRLPELARGLGKSIINFKSAVSEDSAPEDSDAPKKPSDA